MKKFFSVLLMVAFINNSFASVNYQKQLNASFNDVSYKLSQLSDSNGESARKVVKEFTDELNEMISKGLSKQELIEFTKKNIGSEIVAKEMDLILKTTDLTKMTDRQVVELVIETMKNGSAAGSNYIGDYVWQVAGILVAVVILVAIFTAEGCDSTVEECPVYDPYYDPYYDPFYDPFYDPWYDPWYYCTGYYCW